MLKDSETPRYSTRRTHRTYSAAFKAEMIAICQAPGVSVAAVAGQHGMNANVLHRWLHAHRTKDRTEIVCGNVPPSAPMAAFIPLQLPTSTPTPTPRDKDLAIKVELRKGSLSMVVTWPVSAMSEFAAWTAAVLQ